MPKQKGNVGRKEGTLRTEENAGKQNIKRKEDSSQWVQRSTGQSYKVEESISLKNYQQKFVKWI